MKSGAPKLPGASLTIAVWVAVIVASAVFASAGAAKLAGAMIGRFEEWGYAPSLATTIGVLEVIGAFGLVIPRWSARASLGLTVIMFGALGTHVIAGEYVAALAPTAMIVLLGFVLYGRGLGSDASQAGIHPSTEREWWA